MKLFGALSEVVSIVFRKNGQTQTVRPNQTVTYTAARDVQLPPEDANSVIVSESATQTLTNKTLTSPVISSPTGLTKSDVGLGNVDNTSDATKNAAVATLTNKTIDGDDNTLQDIGIASLKTVLADADKVILRDVAGAVVSAKIVDANVDAAAAINATKIGNGDVDNTELSKLNGLSGNITTDSNSQTLTNKTIDGDTNTVQDLPITAIKSVPADANKVLRRDASGLPISGNLIIDTSDLVTVTATQTITNKDIDGGTASNTSRITVPKANTATLSGLTRKEATLVYDTSLAKMFYDNGSSLLAVGSGSATGEINAVLNPSAADATTGYTAGTSHTVTRVTSGSPLDPVITTAIQVQATSTATESSTSGGIYTITTMPSGLQNRKLKVEFYYTTSASQTWAVSVYKSGTRVALSTDSSAVTTLAAGVTGQKFTAYFDTDTTTGYTVNLTRTAGSGTTNLTLTNLVVGPGIQPQGAVVGEWQPYTPTFAGLGTVTSIAMFWKQDGSDLLLRGNFTIGTPSAATAKMSLPNGITVNTSILSGVQLVGEGARSATSSVREITVLTISGDTANLGFSIIGDGSATNPIVPQLGNAAFNASDPLYFETIRVPIAEWAGSGTLNTAQNDVEYAYSTDTSSTSSVLNAFGYGPAGGTFGAGWTIGTSYTRRVSFLSPIQVGDDITIEVSEDSGVTWLPLDAGGGNICQFAIQGSSFYGIQVRSATSTAVDIIFNAQGRSPSNATYAGNGAAWSTLSGGTAKYRVKKEKSGVAVGFGLAGTDGSAGLYKPGQAPGSTTGVAIGAGYLGQELYSVVDQSAGVNLVANSTYYDVTSRSLTAGIWLVSANVIYIRNSATVTATDYECGVWGTTGNSTTGRILGLNSVGNNLGLTTYTTQNITLPHLEIRCDGTNLYYPDGSSTSGTTLYLKAFSSTVSAGNIKAAGRITAIRVG